MSESTVTSKGQVTIPKAVRRELGIRQGSRVVFEVKKGKVEVRVVHRAPAAIESGFGMLKARNRRVPADFDPATLLAPARGRKR